MLRGPLGNSKYRPKFSGHDTFPFRYAWLTKLVNYLEDGKAQIIKDSEKKRLETITNSTFIKPDFFFRITTL